MMDEDDKTGVAVKDKEAGGRLVINRTDEQQPHNRRCRSIQRSKKPTRQEFYDGKQGGHCRRRALEENSKKKRTSTVLTVVALFFSSTSLLLDLFTARRTIIIKPSYGKRIIVALRRGTHFSDVGTVVLIPILYFHWPSCCCHRCRVPILAEAVKRIHHHLPSYQYLGRTRFSSKQETVDEPDETDSDRKDHCSCGRRRCEDWHFSSYGGP
jgi:hypothetical protein